MEAVRIKYTIILYKADGSTETIRTRKRRKITSKLKHDNYEEAHIVAVYTTPTGERIGSNRCVSTREAALRDFETLSEASLREYLGEH